MNNNNSFNTYNDEQLINNSMLQFIDNSSKNFDLKNIIFDILYEKLYLSSIPYNNIFKYSPINNDSTLNNIKTNDYFIAPHINGYNFLLMFVSIHGKKYQLFINKKDIKYYRNQVDINNAHIYSFYCDYKNKHFYELFPLTIFYGKLFNHNYSFNFIIYDCLYFKEQQIINRNINNKIEDLTILINNINSYNINNNITKCINIFIIDIFNKNDIKQLYFDNINLLNNKFKCKINGFIFLPSLSNNIKYFYTGSDFLSSTNYSKKDLLNGYINNNKKNNIPDEHYIHLSIPITSKYISNKYQLDYNLINTFLIKKTNISDVFEVYNINNDNNNVNNRTGILHIPTTKMSHFCKNQPNSTFTHKCIYNHKFKKWMLLFD